ncbi:uncharacterized protein [Antennarius striatus]|uniref:uncharacterized protein isoform X2 n=1 Tax=Antennarius striatus TaxID=241820 RepID=UPI0035AFD7F4
MSADDFETKYASVMASMLKSAVAETTKLFETMVDGLKAEISRIRQENEDLKARCSQFETARGGRAACRGGVPLPGRGGGAERRDTAVQCDLVASSNLLIEECEPVSSSPLQSIRHPGCEGRVYALQEHDYDNFHVVLPFIKQESVRKQEDIKSSPACEQHDDHEAEHLLNTPCSNREMQPQRPEEIHLVIDNSISGIHNGSLRPERQSAESWRSSLASLPGVKEDMSEESGVGLKISDVCSQRETAACGKQRLSAQHQPEVGNIEREQPLLVSQQCGSESQSVKKQTSSQPQVVRRQRGRPPKRAKRLQRQAKDTLQPLTSDVPAEKEVDSPQIVPIQTNVSSATVAPPVQEKEKGADGVSSTEETVDPPPAETPQTSSVQTTDCGSSVPLQDAMLLLEAMNQSVEKKASSSTQTMVAKLKTQCAPQGVDEASAQTPLHSVQSHGGEVDQQEVEPSKTTQSTKEKLVECHQTTDEVQAHIQAVTPKQAHPESVTKDTTSSVSSATETSSCGRPSPPVTSVPSRNLRSTLLHTIIIVPRSESSVPPPPRKLSFVSTGSTADDLFARTRSVSLSPKKIIKGTSRTCLKVLRQSNTKSTRVTAGDDSNKSIAPSSVSLVVFPSQESNPPEGAQTTVLSHKRHNAEDSLESPKSTDSVSGRRLHTETRSQQKLSCVVRLSRLPFLVSPNESVFLSTLPANGSLESHVFSKGVTIEDKAPCDRMLAQPEGTLDICPGLHKTPVGSINTPVMSREPNDNQEKLSLSSENLSRVVELPDSGITPPSTSIDKSKPVLENPPMTSIVTKPPAVAGTPDVDTEMIVVEDCSVPQDRPMDDKQPPATLLHPTPSEDTSNPRSQEPEKPSSNESLDTRASGAGSSNKNRPHKTPLIDRLRSHIKTHLQTRRMERDQESPTEMAPKKLKLDDDCPKQKNKLGERFSFSAIAANSQRTHISRKMSRQFTDGGKPTGTTSKSSVRSTRSGANNDSASANHQMFSSSQVGSKNEKAPVGSPRRTSSAQENSASKNISMHPKTNNPARRDASPKNGKINGSPTNKRTPGRPRKTSLSQDSVTPKRTKSTIVSSKASALDKNSNSPKISTNASLPAICRMLNVTKNDLSDKSSTVGIKEITDSRSPERRTEGPKQANGGTILKKIRESTSVKARLNQDAANAKKNPREMNTKPIAKAKTAYKLENCNQLQNEAKKRRLAEHHVSSKAGKKCRSKGVWTPPKSSALDLKPPHSPARKETKSPRSEERPLVYPPSVPLHPIPLRAPPVVSPLQPLSVIGRRLLKNQCGECGRVLSSNVALESHVRLHKGRRPFSCPLCGKSFADSKGLKRHGRAHRNGRIHVCQHCGKGFVYTFGLTKHIQMVHRRLKPFVCQICNKGCFTKLDVEAHIRIHTGEKPFHCNLCEKKFARRGDLNLHLRWHNGEKRHWCPYCGKGFLDSNNLKRHKYTHTGEKPHPCPHCPKHFSQSGHLKKHVKNVHGK